MRKTNEIQQVLKDLKKIYRIAIKNKNLNIALQTQKAIANIINKNDNKEDISLNTLNKEQIEKLIKEGEESGIEIKHRNRTKNSNRNTKR